MKIQIAVLAIATFAACQGRDPADLDPTPPAMCVDALEAACRSCNDGCNSTSIDECHDALDPSMDCAAATAVDVDLYSECMRRALGYVCGDPLPVVCADAFTFGGSP